MDYRDDWKAWQQNLLGKINFSQEYNALGCRNTGIPDSKGWVACLSHTIFGAADLHPSAGFQHENGVYKDFRQGWSGSFFDFLVEVGVYLSWIDARNAMAKKYGMDVPKADRRMRGEKKVPDDELTPSPWSDAATAEFCNLKPPITTAGLKRSGANIGRLTGTPALYWPIYDVQLHVTGFYAMALNGRPFNEDGTKKSCVVKQSGAVNGLVGPGVRTLASSRAGDIHYVVHWTEGLTDALAGVSHLQSTALWVSSPSGCAEQMNATQLAFFENNPNISQIIIFADADWPGLRGAAAKYDALGTTGIERVIVRPKGEITTKLGRDLRDILTTHGDCMTWDIEEVSRDTLRTMLAERDIVDTEARQVHAQAQVRERDEAGERHLKRLGVEVISSAEDRATIFFRQTGKVLHDRRLSDLKHEDWGVLLGQPFTDSVAAPGDPAGGKIPYDNFKQAVAHKAHDCASRNMKAAGSGVWKADDGSLFLVNKGQCFSYMDRALVPASPLYRNLCGEVQDAVTWLRPAELSACVRQAQFPEYRLVCFEELAAICETRNWGETYAGRLAASLYIASLLQDAWPYRPVVVIMGPTASGKSKLFETLRRLAGGLAVEVAKPSMAGVLQTIQGNRQLILVDEIDQMKELNEMLSSLRLASNGQQSVRGTAHQKARTYEVNHIAWLAGIYQDGDSRADANRQITLTLQPTEGRYHVPSVKSGQELGERLLACALVLEPRVQELLAEIEAGTIDHGESARRAEMLTLPLAIEAAFRGKSAQWALDSLDQMQEGTGLQSMTAVHDHTEVVNLILTTQLEVFRSNPFAANTLARMAKLVWEGSQDLTEEYKSWETAGVKFYTDQEGGRHIGLHIKTLVGKKGLLGNTEWVGKLGIARLLRQSKVFGSRSDQQRMGGPRVPIVRWDLDLVRGCIEDSDEEGSLFGPIDQTDKKPDKKPDTLTPYV